MLIHPTPIISSELRPKGKHDKDEKRTTCQRSNKNAYQMIFCKDIRCNTVFFLIQGKSIDQGRITSMMKTKKERFLSHAGHERNRGVTFLFVKSS